MNETFADFLNQVEADADTIEQALLMHLSERTNDLTQEEMLAQLHGAAQDAQELDRQLEVLGQDPAALEQAAHVYFEHAWQDDAQRPSIRASFKHAKGDLAVLEVAILAVAAMYGMYLMTTGGIIEITVEQKPDGSSTTTLKKEPFSPIVSAMARLFGNKG